MTRSPRPHGTAKLSESIHQRLNMYALVASASGVGLLALTPLAEAKIIYTPAHAKITSGPRPIDLNHDGIVDFYLFNHYPVESGQGFSLSVCQHTTSASTFYFGCRNGGTNAVRATLVQGTFRFATALRKGAKVQRGRFFTGRNNMGKESTFKGTTWHGRWFNGGKGVRNRYLGLKFEIKGRFHFGWARLTVTINQRASQLP
jgi:hypothetical protein